MKSIIHHFKGFSLKQIKPAFLEVENPTIRDHLLHLPVYSLFSIISNISL